MPAAILAENIKKHRDAFAAKRGVYSGSEGLSSHQLLPPHGQEKLTQLMAEQKMESRCGIGGSFIGDVSQSPERARGSSWILPCSKSSVLVSLNKNHIFTPLEIAAAHGWPVFRNDLQDCIQPLLLSLSPNEAKLLSGNGMHLCQVYAWMIFTLTHTLRREPLKYYKPPKVVLSPKPTDDSEVVDPGICTND